MYLIIHFTQCVDQRECNVFIIGQPYHMIKTIASHPHTTVLYALSVITQQRIINEMAHTYIVCSGICTSFSSLLLGTLE